MPTYDYQQHQIENTALALSSKRKVLVQLPTGGGKTVEFSFLSQRFIRSTGQGVLILVHREELMYQAQRTIKDMIDIDATLITSKSKHYRLSRVYIGMVESLVKRLDIFSNVGLVIVDECHIANFNKIHSIFLEELIAGFSATPISSSKKEPCNKYYHDIIVGPTIKELISYGFLAQNITRCPKNIVDSTQFEIDNRKGDYNENKMAIEFKKPRYIAGVLDSYHKYCYGKKTIIFNVTIEHSEQVNEAFQELDIDSRHLASGVDDRAGILKWFKETPGAVLNNVMIATVGFDEPTIECVILNYSTLSLVKFIQTCGRGSRSLNGKKYFNIIDLGGNCIRFGDWNEDRDWEYMFNHPETPSEGIAPVKTCPDCEGLVHASSMTCTNLNSKGELCMYEFERKKTPEEQDLHEMVLITKGINIDSLVEKNIKKYEYFTFFEIADEVVKTMYDNHSHPSENILLKYFRIYYLLCCEWYKKELAGKNGNIPDIEFSTWHIIRAQNNFNQLVQKNKPNIITLDQTVTVN